MVDNVENRTIDISELLNRAEGNVLVLDKYAPTSFVENESVVATLTKAFDNIYYQVDLSEYKAERIDIKVLEATKKYFHEWYDNLSMPRPVLLSDAYYLDADDAKNKIILNKVAEEPHTSRVTISILRMPMSITLCLRLCLEKTGI